jgi:hypothetical protein
MDFPGMMPPLPLRLLRAADRAATAMGVAGANLETDDLMQCALERMQISAFRDRAFVPALRRLLDSYEREADLNLFGRYAARWDVLRCLTNLLRFEAEEARAPEILQQRIERPIFITGLPRSGTTLLHALLALDPALRAPRCWQTISPYPEGAKDDRRETVERQLRLFQRLTPDMAAMHPMAANSPQECTEITAQIFQSLRYEMTYRVPSYQAWIDGHGHLPAYRFHKRFLQHRQHQEGGGRWVLKSPDHIHALSAIKSVYPDCGLVFVHRDPLRVIASAAKLTEAVRQPFARCIDKVELGVQALNRLKEAVETMLEIAKADRGGNIFHLRYTDFAKNPMASIETLYRHFDLKLDNDLRRRMRAFLAATPAPSNHYAIEEFGIDPRTLRDAFQDYIQYFGVAPEAPVWCAGEDIRIPIAA